MLSDKNWPAAIICLLGAIFFAWHYVVDKNEADVSTHWERVTAVIDSSAITSSYSRSGRSFHAHVSYHFNAGGKAHHSSRISFPDPGTTGEASCQAIVDRYPSGTLTQAYYDPKNPDDCCLITGEQPSLKMEGVVALVLMGLSGLMLLLPRGRYRNGAMYNNPLSMITPSR